MALAQVHKKKQHVHSNTVHCLTPSVNLQNENLISTTL